jgi:lipopolysaccharide export LptBFGC system permease protein LptF
MATIDRYLLRGLAGRFAATVAAVLTILALENAGRLAADLQHTRQPLLLLARLSLLLVPEHLAIAVPVAILLATALTVRAMTLRGEWQMFAAGGLSPWRIARAPMLLAVLVAGVQLADRLEWRPAGESGLDALYREVVAGRHGAGLPIGQPIRLDAATTLFIAGASGERLTGLFVQRGDDSFAAPLARLSAGAGGQATIDLQGGVFVHRNGARLRRLHFGHLSLDARLPMAAMAKANARQRLDRQGLFGLWRQAVAGGGDGIAATAALVTRIDDALFCLLLPWLGIALGQPPRRSQAGAGIVAGLVLVVLHLETSAFVEDHLASYALVAGVGHVALWTAAVAWLARWAGRVPGAVDLALAAALRWRPRLPALRPRAPEFIPAAPAVAVAPWTPRRRPAPAFAPTAASLA